MAVEHEGDRVDRVFTGAHPVGELVAAVDWAATPLGPVEGWDPQLRSVVRTMVSSRQQMVLFWGPERIALYNDAYAPTIGDKHPRALGRPARENWGELWDVLAPLLDRVSETGTPFWAQDHPFPIARHGFLEQTFFDVSYDPVYVDTAVDGSEPVTVGGVLCLVTETTGRVLGERRMRTLSRLGTLLTGVGDGERVGRVAATALADNPEDVPGALLYLIDGPDALRLIGEVHHRAAPPSIDLAGADVTAEVLRTVLSDGEAAWLATPPGGGSRALVLPLTSLDGVCGVLVVTPNPMLDISNGYREFLDLVATAVSAALVNTARHDAERGRIRTLAELDRAKTELFANISHELRTPLTLIAGPAEDALTDESTPLAPPQRERVELIRRNAARLVRMVENILDFTRIERGALRAEPGATDLALFTAAIADSFRPAVERAGLRLLVDARPLPRPVSVDRDMWQRVVLNLLSNALKFTLQGSVEVVVSDHDGRARLTVADTGLGIPEDELPRLFDRFHRVRQPAARSREGTGIGLALAAELVRLHGGEIEVASESGAGSTFTVVLPYGDADAGTSAPARGAVAEAYLDEALGWSGETGSEPLPHTDPRSTGGSRVLVVEDNADLRGFLVRLLERQWEVVVAANGDEALTAVRRSRPDLVLTDVVMPGLDGFELLAELRGNPSTEHIPVILLSARAGEEAAIEGLAAGADDYLSKPFSAQELVARVRSNLELSRLRNHQAAWRAALVESLDDGFFMMDAAGTILEMNAACGQILGFDATGLPYPRPYPWWPVSEVDPTAARRMEDALDEALAGGGGRFEVPARRDTGRRVWLAVSVNEVPPLGAGPKLFVGTVRDVTTDRVAAERDSALATFAAALADATDVGEVLAAAISGLGAAWATRPAVVVTWVQEVDGAGARDSDLPTVVADVDRREWAGLPSVARSALLTAKRTRTPQVVPEPGAGRRSLGIAARLDAPGEETAVWLELDPPQRVADVDRYLFGSLCAQLGLALTRARSFDQQRTVAVTLQRSILGPTNLPDGFAVRYEPALEPLEVGGDWYDVVRLDEHRVGVVVGDCVGRGLRAASVMGQLRSACRALLQQAIDPAQVLTALDDFAELLPGATCTTVFCAIVDTRAGTLVYSSAGHLPGIVASADGTDTLLDGAGSVPLAVRGTGPRPQATLDLEDGCTVLLYTDGLVERRGEIIDAGIARATGALVEAATAPTLDEALDRVIVGLVPDRGHDDDVAALVYRYTAGGQTPASAASADG